MISEERRTEIAGKINPLRTQCLNCSKCEIGKCRITLADGKEYGSNVFSSMVPAEVMVVGQNPGAEEIVAGVPFVGKSGQIFDEALERIVGLRRSDVYVTNVVKCFTPLNRKPSDQEVLNCRHFLDREIEAVKPKVVLALGSHALKALTGMSGIMKHCGEAIYSIRHGVYVVATLHPSPHNTNVPERLAKFQEGLAGLAKFLREQNG